MHVTDCDLPACRLVGLCSVRIPAQVAILFVICVDMFAEQAVNVGLCPNTVLAVSAGQAPTELFIAHTVVPAASSKFASFVLEQNARIVRVSICLAILGLTWPWHVHRTARELAARIELAPLVTDWTSVILFAHATNRSALGHHVWIVWMG